MKPAFLTFAAASLAAGSAHAADAACVVTLDGDDAAWREAVASLERSLPREASPADCAELSVSLGPDGAELRFATRDGRSVRRALAAPDELAPTVQALRVSYGLPVAVAAAGDDEPDEPPPAAETVPIVVEQKVDRRVPTRVSYALTLGTRGSTELHSPTLEAAVGFGVGLLDLGAMVRVEGHYTNSDDAAMQPDTTAVGVGVNVGARLPVGPLALAVGGHIMLAAFAQDATAAFPDTEGRVGAYVNLVAPRRTRTRLRVGVSGEGNVSKGGAQYAGTTQIMPGWAVLLAVGVEYGEP